VVDCLILSQQFVFDNVSGDKHFFCRFNITVAVRCGKPEDRQGRKWNYKVSISRYAYANCYEAADKKYDKE
jgi:hypothetical protein